MSMFTPVPGMLEPKPVVARRPWVAPALTLETLVRTGTAKGVTPAETRFTGPSS